jgi:glycosyltransferase involved in cell wall biosynthesis
MRVQLVDPAAYTPPYDHALAAALTRAGADVELVTTRFAHGAVTREPGYRVRELFYRGAAARVRSERSRRALRALEHLPGMLAHRRHARQAEVVHYQWLPLPDLDARLLAPVHPRLLTFHPRLPDPHSRRGRALRRLLARMDAVVVHTEHGSDRLTSEFGVPSERLEVIPHGALEHLARLPQEKPLPAELRDAEAPVILAFGLIRPYKGAEVLLEAFRRIEGAELWIVGRPMMPTGPLHELARRGPGRVRFVERFVEDAEIPALMRRADLIALPYLEIEQSGVLQTALAFGRPLVLSDVGGFSELGRHGAARVVRPGDAEALAAALSELLADPGERERLARAAAEAAGGLYSWDRIGERTLALYRRLLA